MLSRILVIIVFGVGLTLLRANLLDQNAIATTYSSIPSLDASGDGSIPDLSYGSASVLSSGRPGPNDVGWWTNQIQWNLPANLLGATVNSASITLPLRYGTGSSFGAVGLQAYNVSWNESATHRTRDGVNLWTGATAGSSVGGRGGGNDRVLDGSSNKNFDIKPVPAAPYVSENVAAATVVFDAKTLVEYWAAGNVNFGAAFQIIEPVNPSGNTLFTHWSREWTPAGGAPGDLASVLSIDYTPGGGSVSTAWGINGSGSWNSSLGWSPAFIPNGNNVSVTFGDAISNPRTVFSDASVTAKNILFDNTNTYAIAGAGEVTLEANTGDASIVVQQGAHQFQTVVSFNSATDVDVAGNAILAFYNALNIGSNNLTKEGTGTLQINSSLNTGNATVNAEAGVVSGGGLVSGALNNTGATVAPGNSVGALSVGGNYVQGEGGTLAIELGGTLDGEFDVLDIAGTATLDGILDISLLSFTPSPNDSFTVLSADLGITDDGITLIGDMANDFSLSQANGNTDLVLTFQAGSAGDFDLDGDVDGNDFLVWQRGVGTTFDADDLADWQSHYGVNGGALEASSAAVPEPAFWPIICTIALAITVSRNRREGISVSGVFGVASRDVSCRNILVVTAN